METKMEVEKSHKSLICGFEKSYNLYALKAKS